MNNIAKSAVVSGTATPGAKVSIGSQEVEADKASGAWSITVTGLKDGANELTAVQTIGGTKHDEKTVTATIVEGGTIVATDAGPIELERGDETDVPFIVQNNETRSDMVGTVTLDAPEGTTFAEGQTTAAASYRSGTSGEWKTYGKLDLREGVRSEDGKKMTFSLDTDGGNMVSGEQYKYVLKVTTPENAPAGSNGMDFVYAGDSTKGDFRAEGKTTTTIETAEVALEAQVESVDHAAKTAVISGTATPGATVSIGDQTVEADAETGAWSITVRDLDEGANELTVTQKIGDDEIDSKDLTVTINSAAISGQDGAPVTLDRDADTSVEALFKTNGSISRPQGTVEFTAPEGTTFAAGQNTINGAYKVPGDDWKNTAMTLSNGVRSEDGTKYTYDFTTTNSTWNLPADSLMRWNIKVTTPADAEAGTPSMSTKLVGTAVEGAFNTTSTTSTTIESAEAPAPAPLVVTTPADNSTVDTKRPVFSGTGDEGATIEVRGKSGRLVATAVVKDGEWSAPASFDLNDNSYTLDVFQKPLQGAPSQTEVTFRVATNPLTTELTAVGAFDDDVTKPATISGDATTGAIVIVKDSLGNEIGRTEAKDGKYSIPVPPSAAHTGVNDFTVTQTKNGSTSPEKDVQLDYGTPAALNITSPEDNSTVQKQGLTFTGTGDEGARIDIRGTVRAIATGTVSNGTWTAPVTVDLSNNVYNLRAVQTTKGGLTTQQPITITIVDEAPAAPLTATARFNTTDENLPAEMTGTANPGATITIKDSKGVVVNTGQASDKGTYTVLIPANKAHFGVNDFTVTQTVRGQVSPALERSLDYGTPAAPVIQTPENGATVTNGSIRFTGTGATGAKLDMRGNTSSIGATTIADGAWSVDVTRELNPAVYALHALQTSKGGLTKRADITVTIRNEAPIAPLTATAAFNTTDENLPAAITGTANPGATVTVKDSDGKVVDTAIATGGRYSITIPPSKAHFGVNDFTVTQTVRGQVSPALERSLDYGTPAAPVIQTPENGATVTNGSIRFTGTGATGAKLDMRGNTSSIGATTIADGAWSVDVTRELNPAVYALHALQTSKGGLTKRADITVTIRNEQVTALTATGTLYPEDVEKNGTISGNAQTGADVIVREGVSVVKSVKAVDGKYSVEIPATVDGVRTFTVTQTVKGQVSAPKTATLDYGTPADLVIETPDNGGTLRGDQIVFTGTGAPGAKVVLNGTVSRLGSATVNEQGAWTITVERTLRPQDYTLFTKQITKGNLNGPADQRTITVTQ